MTRALRAIRKATAMLVPWATRSERHAAIDAATAQKQKSFRDLGTARVIEEQINQITAANHWAMRVAEGLGISYGDKNGDK